MKFARTGTPAIQLQLAPMIDVVFLLLCFFMSATLFSHWETDVPITLPTADTGEDLRRFEGEIIINVYADGTYVVNSRSLASRELGELLGRISELFPGQPVVVRGDQDTPYQYIMDVMDRCREADIFNISFAAARPE